MEQSRIHKVTMKVHNQDITVAQVWLIRKVVAISLSSSSSVHFLYDGGNLPSSKISFHTQRLPGTFAPFSIFT